MVFQWLIYMLGFALTYAQVHTHTHTTPSSAHPHYKLHSAPVSFFLAVVHLRRDVPGLEVHTLVSDCTSIFNHQEIIITVLRMSFDTLPIMEIFLSILGFGLSIMFCTTFCRACSRFREDQIEREAWRRSEQDGHAPSIYFIPFPRSRSQQDSEDHLRVPRYSQELQSPPRYSMAGYCGPPPSYNELGLKPDDLPPSYTEYNTPVCAITPPPHTDMVQPQTQSQQ